MDVIIVESEHKDSGRIVALKMPERLRQRIRQEAFSREMSFSAMVRRILEEHYALIDGGKDAKNGNDD